MQSGLFSVGQVGAVGSLVNLLKYQLIHYMCNVPTISYLAVCAQTVCSCWCHARKEGLSLTVTVTINSCIVYLQV